MDIDFHYYATYKAALLAGWNNSDAETIATAAQFVDEFDYTFGYGKHPWVFDKNIDLPEPLYGKLRYEPSSDGKGIVIPRKTVQNYKNDFMLTKHTRTDIWMTFHFLPGNFDFSDSAGRNVPEYKSRSGASKLLCRPFSQTAISMINDLLDYKKTDYFLHLLGLRMHVFADTWAHQDFVGDAVKSANDCAGYYNFFETADGVMEQVDWHILFAGPNSEYAPVTQYLGHGRLGHFPDFGWCRFYYTPAWLNKTSLGQTLSGVVRGGKSVYMLERNNPTEFETAFFEMVKVLYAVKNNIEYPSEHLNLNKILSGLEGHYREEFRKTNILDNKSASFNSDYSVFEQSIAKWKNFGAQSGLSVPPNFDVAGWRGVPKKSTFKYADVKADSDVYRFNLASEHHYAFIRDMLRKNNIVDVRGWDDATPQFARNVPWVADNDRARCSGCNVQFTTFTRRHHCRTCGEIYCNKCAPVGATTGVRICNKCLAKHDQQINQWVKQLTEYNIARAKEQEQIAWSIANRH